MLIDNINYLRKHCRPIREYLKSNEDQLQKEPIQIVNSKSGYPTLYIENKNGTGFIHSKYDPINEAKQLANKYKDELVNYNHVFFYGIGLGYAVEIFAESFPHLTFTLYEPSPSVFYHYLTCKKIEDLPQQQIKNIHLETSEEGQLTILNHFANQMMENVLLITLPSYERIFEMKHKEFLNNFNESISSRRTSFITDLVFEKLWTLNSVMNFLEVLKTPNILHDFDKNLFKNKPAIIVSAGPSLNDEIENLKYIKKNKSAYIFAVGSANKTLLKNGIYPDAVCTYDPYPHNFRVFEEIIENDIREIPMIFGSSVGFETLKRFPGPKVHMLTSQDTVSNYYLESYGLNKVNDAPSIAVVTFHLLSQLEANPIILVGQNLGYRGNYFYSNGIDYGGNNTLTEEEKTNALTVRDIDGNEIYTNESFLNMKKDFERYISHFNNIEVINTTIGGAHINGTTFVPLVDVISQKLTAISVDENWLKNTGKTYDMDIVRQKQVEMDFALDEFSSVMRKLNNTLKRMEQLVREEKKKQLEKQFINFDDHIKRLEKNHFFNVFLKPMVRVSLDLLTKRIQSVRFHNDILFKGETIFKATAKFIYECQHDFHRIMKIYPQLKRAIEISSEIEVNK